MDHGRRCIVETKISIIFTWGSPFPCHSRWGVQRLKPKPADGICATEILRIRDFQRPQTISLKIYLCGTSEIHIFGIITASIRIGTSNQYIQFSSWFVVEWVVDSFWCCRSLLTISRLNTSSIYLEMVICFFWSQDPLSPKRVCYPFPAIPYF